MPVTQMEPGLIPVAWLREHPQIPVAAEGWWPLLAAVPSVTGPRPWPVVLHGFLPGDRRDLRSM